MSELKQLRGVSYAIQQNILIRSHRAVSQENTCLKSFMLKQVSVLQK